ncbi:hypothetical protein C5O25_10450 [Paramuribaculum intestinale]|uniref:Uncharacterized protein n=1 Tax=Paramuribaculum intestinale TaxID=2094151 RepID=A0A2V1IUE1_9BACT|nr:hypothetical protein C5O24_11140 [Paramuribaculum intestinale]PWB06426.1 hypothetical protein C5O25_10450 [Paramuribaculum intestinale]ROS93219.1 hypothetical protein EEL36_05720 [Muribaculaceae bacterium Isolate-043 (Harlan)]
MNQYNLCVLTAQEWNLIHSKVKDPTCPHCHALMALDNKVYALLALDNHFHPTPGWGLRVIRFVCPVCGHMDLFDGATLLKGN